MTILSSAVALDQLGRGSSAAIFSFSRVVDDGEIAVVERDESVVAPAARHVERRLIDAVRREQAGGLGVGRQIGVEAEHDVGLGRLALRA